jgi:hypothetical protein
MVIKLFSHEGPWEELLINKYLHGKTDLKNQAKPTDSPFWNGFMGVKEDFFQKGSFVIRDGIRTRFWEDPWLDDTPLASQYPCLFNIVRAKEVIFVDVLSQVPSNIKFNTSR